MTPEDAIVAAQGVVSEYTDLFPRTESVMFNRINVRQRELFTLARGWNREFYGVCLTSQVAGGTVNLTQSHLINQSVYPVESLDLVRVADPGSSSYSSGDKVHIVPADDQDGHLPPRMTFRSGVLEQVGTDLANVASVKVYYGRRPKTIDSSGKVEDVLLDLEIEAPYDYLIVWDLSKDLVRRTAGLEGEAKTAIYAIMNEGESSLLKSFQQHVMAAGYAREDRFDV